MMIFNERFMTFAVSIFVSYLAAYLFWERARNESEEKYVNQAKQMMAVLLLSANLLTIFAGSQEIAGYYNEQIKILEAQQQKTYELQGGYNRYGRSQNNYSSSGKNFDSFKYQSQYEDMKKLRNRRDISLSLFWLFYAIVVLAVGFLKKYKSIRLGGIALLLLAIFKLFFYDLWSLGTLYRIISSISLGVVLLSISFVYQKYKDKLKEIIV